MDGALYAGSQTGPGYEFTTTHWSVVVQAAGTDPEQAAEALEELCRTYWYPLYAYVRRRGYGPEDAQDLTQGFFARFVAKESLQDVDRSKGRFRSFLLAAMKHSLANEWDRTQAQKRGGQAHIISFERAAAEHRYREEPMADLPPDKLYEQRWACVLLERVMERLAEDFKASGKSDLFQALEPFLLGDKHSATYTEVGSRFGLSEAAVKMKVQRLRHRYQSLLRQEIAHTVVSADEVEDEIRFLFRVLSG